MSHLQSHCFQNSLPHSCCSCKGLVFVSSNWRGETDEQGHVTLGATQSPQTSSSVPCVSCFSDPIQHQHRLVWAFWGFAHWLAVVETVEVKLGKGLSHPKWVLWILGWWWVSQPLARASLLSLSSTVLPCCHSSLESWSKSALQTWHGPGEQKKQKKKKRRNRGKIRVSVSSAWVGWRFVAMADSNGTPKDCLASAFRNPTPPRPGLKEIMGMADSRQRYFYDFRRPWPFSGLPHCSCFDRILQTRNSCCHPSAACCKMQGMIAPRTRSVGMPSVLGGNTTNRFGDTKFPVYSSGWGQGRQGDSK